METLKPGELVRLHQQTRAPGDGWLELRVTPESGGSRYDQRAIFIPRGILGRLYWYALLPMHALALRALAKGIVGG